MSSQVMLTTIDNPFDPFKDFDKWLEYDLAKGYNTCAYLARVAKVSSEIPENLNRLEIEQAIDEICNYNILGIYRKVTKDN